MIQITPNEGKTESRQKVGHAPRGKKTERAKREKEREGKVRLTGTESGKKMKSVVGADVVDRNKATFPPR